MNIHHSENKKLAVIFSLAMVLGACPQRPSPGFVRTPNHNNSQSTPWVAYLQPPPHTHESFWCDQTRTTRCVTDQYHRVLYSVTPSGYTEQARSRQLPVHGWRGMWNLGTHWLFLSNDGMLYRGTSFTSNLEAVGSFPDTIHSQAHSHLYPTLLSQPEGRLLVWNGQNFVTPDFLQNIVLQSAVYFNQQQGIVITASNRLLYTSDGQSFALRHPLLTAPITELSTDRGDVYIQTSGFTVKVTPSGSSDIVAPIETRQDSPFFSRQWLPVNNSELLFFYSPEGNTRRIEFPPDGQWASDHEFCEFDTVSGHRFYRTCRGEASERLQRYVPNSGWQTLATLQDENHRIGFRSVSSVDESYVLVFAPSWEERRESVQGEWHHNNTVEQFNFRPDTDAIVAVSNRYLLVKHDDGTHGGLYFSLATVSNHELQTTQLNIPIQSINFTRPNDIDHLFVSFTPSGDIVVRYSPESVPHIYATLTLEQALHRELFQLRRAPARTTELAFSDALHGVAVGNTMRNSFITEDSGQTWRAVPFWGVDQHTSLPALSNSPLTRSSVYCVQTGCVLGNFQAFWGSSSVHRTATSSDIEWIGSTTPIPPLATRNGTPSPVNSTRIHCRASPAPMPSSGPGRPQPDSLFIYGAGSIAQFTPTQRGSGYSVQWSGQDTQGYFQQTTSVPWRFTIQPHNDRSQPRLIFASRTTLVAQHCNPTLPPSPPNTNSTNCRLFYYFRQGSSGSVALTTEQIPPTGYGTEVLSGLALPQGSIVIPLHRYPFTISAIELSSNGNIRTFPALSLSETPHWMPGMYQSQPGVFWVNREVTGAIHFEPFDPTIAASQLPLPSDVQSCTAVDLARPILGQFHLVPQQEVSRTPVFLPIDGNPPFAHMIHIYAHGYCSAASFGLNANGLSTGSLSEELNQASIHTAFNRTSGPGTLRPIPAQTTAVSPWGPHTATCDPL